MANYGILLLLPSLLLGSCQAFVVSPCSSSFSIQQQRTAPPVSLHRTTQLHYTMVDVGTDGPFFSITFAVLGLLLSISKQYARVRMEERAWEQRLAEGRHRNVRLDPTLSELELRKQEAAHEYSAYGRRKVQTLEKTSTESTTTSKQEQFERDFGIAWDPYYDEPYEEDELPKGNYSVDKLYGDRLYDNGEIFYKDGNQYYRQGCQPRLSFF